jgi:hypothetical protein
MSNIITAAVVAGVAACLTAVYLLVLSTDRLSKNTQLNIELCSLLREGDYWAVERFMREHAHKLDPYVAKGAWDWMLEKLRSPIATKERGWE